MDLRIRVAAGLLFGVLSVLGTANALAAAPLSDVRYSCDGGQMLLVRSSVSSASVRFADRTYELQQKHSSIGQKYLSSTAALIVDGRSAVFVAEDGLQIARCVESSRVASAQ